MNFPGSSGGGGGLGGGLGGLGGGIGGGVPGIPSAGGNAGAPASPGFDPNDPNVKWVLSTSPSLRAHTTRENEIWNCFFSCWDWNLIGLVLFLG